MCSGGGSQFSVAGGGGKFESVVEDWRAGEREMAVGDLARWGGRWKG